MPKLFDKQAGDTLQIGGAFKRWLYRGQRYLGPCSERTRSGFATYVGPAGKRFFAAADTKKFNSKRFPQLNVRRS